MKKITLSEAQKREIMSKLAEVHNTTGKFGVQIDMDNYTFIIDGWVEIDGYVEDDYFNGTGAFVETYRNAKVTITGWLYNPYNNHVEDLEIEDVKEFENYLNAA
jgi:hypothetical protein